MAGRNFSRYLVGGLAFIALAAVLTVLSPASQQQQQQQGSQIWLKSGRESYSSRQYQISMLCHNFRQDLVIPQATHAARPSVYCGDAPVLSPDPSSPSTTYACRRNAQYVAIGMVKSGTATLQRIAAMHPLIRTHKSPERHFFDSIRDIDTVQKYFHSYLNTFENNKPKKTNSDVDMDESYVYGEHTPSYIWQINYRCNVFQASDCIDVGFTPDVESIINKIKSVLPEDTMIAVTIRNPVDRAYSHFAHFYGCDHEKYTNADFPQCFHDLILEETQTLEHCFTMLGELDIACIHNPLNRVWKGGRLVSLGLYAVFFRLWYQHFPNLCVLDVVSKGKDLGAVAGEFQSCLGMSQLSVPSVDWNNITHSSQVKRIDPMYNHTRRLLEQFYKPYNQLLCHMVPHTCEWDWVKQSFE